MITEAPTELMRHGTMLQWLMKNGLSRFEIETLLKTGVIRARPIRPGGRAWYNASQIMKDVLNGGEDFTKQQ